MKQTKEQNSQTNIERLEDVTHCKYKNRLNYVPILNSLTILFYFVNFE